MFTVTGFLASVTSVVEARTALAAGADLIDFKDPTRGALGALDPGVVRAALAEMPADVTTSAAAGELPTPDHGAGDRLREIAASGVVFIKVGLPAGPDRPQSIRYLGRSLCRQARIVAVLYAEQPHEPELLDLLRDTGFAGVMLDTAGKDSGSLRTLMSEQRLRAFVDRGRRLGLVTGLAGSLQADDISLLLPLRPDYLGFRGALCGATGRTGVLQSSCAQGIRDLIPLRRHRERYSFQEAEVPV